ncbi:outer membrane beta-barrel protein [Formosa sp. 3Alg 14/1]|uniref:outer membrane beta-barrel protein n=1 Tax=Formosa sp. 3Alg 14/1 TaxID=3382190 RepID=UPI0039BDF3C4
MKKIMAILCIVFATIQLTSAQMGTGFGVKGGLNYSSSGKYSSTNGENIDHSDKSMGFNIGVFGKFGTKIYLKHEVLFTQTNQSYNDDDFKVQKVDSPVLLGVQLYGPLALFAGPSFQYILNAKLDGKKAEERSSKDITVGFNIGFAYNINRIGIDLRYAQGFNPYELEFRTNSGSNVTIDSKPEQLILSISYKL